MNSSEDSENLANLYTENIKNDNDNNRPNGGFPPFYLIKKPNTQNRPVIIKKKTKIINVNDILNIN
jgi:hypothetical protein